jgi:EAL domain-containing protein (putative c-di-GMP-specific phosphodiesterase class I)
MAQVQFDVLLTKPAVYPYFQPIVRLADAGRVAYEVLCRSPLIGLETPPKMFRVAALRSSENELSRVCRWEGLRGAQSLGTEIQYYLNTHPGEIGTGELLDSLIALRAAFPAVACVLEVHESAAASTGHLRDLRSVLNDLDMQLAYDDFGAGQARIAELTEVPPDVLKFDIKLVRHLGSASRQRRATVESLVRMVRDLEIVPLAEGVESHADADACREIGFELAQGYLFGKPGPASQWSGADPANAS